MALTGSGPHYLCGVIGKGGDMGTRSRMFDGFLRDSMEILLQAVASRLRRGQELKKTEAGHRFTTMTSGVKQRFL